MLVFEKNYRSWFPLRKKDFAIRRNYFSMLRLAMAEEDTRGAFSSRQWTIRELQIQRRELTDKYIAGRVDCQNRPASNFSLYVTAIPDSFFFLKEKSWWWYRAEGWEQHLFWIFDPCNPILSVQWSPEENINWSKWSDLLLFTFL